MRSNYLLSSGETELESLDWKAALSNQLPSLCYAFAIKSPELGLSPAARVLLETEPIMLSVILGYQLKGGQGW